MKRFIQYIASFFWKPDKEYNHFTQNFICDSKELQSKYQTFIKTHQNMEVVSTTCFQLHKSLTYPEHYMLILTYKVPKPCPTKK